MFKEGDRVRVKDEVAEPWHKYAGRCGTIVRPTDRFITEGGQKSLNNQKIYPSWIVLLDEVNEEIEIFGDDLELVKE